MGCYLIKESCPCINFIKENEIVKSSGRKSEKSCDDSSEHDIWEDSPSLQKEFEHSISRAVADSEESSSSGKSSKSKKNSNLTVKTLQADKHALDSNRKLKDFIKSKTFGN